ncbi:MAG: universal stress protein [Bacteroidetes bacterium]|jgi:nucleotide-binding universal stress UspA family protein|nr:universal stress protein [Bacteroidota bacterium]
MSTKKFLAIFDGLKYSTSTTSYAIELAKMADAYVAGAFLDDFTYHSHSLTGRGGYAKLLAERKHLHEHDTLTRSESVKKFNKTCDDAGIEHIVHHDQSIAIREAIHESVYADMLILSKSETFTQYEQDTPSSFIKEMLAGSECPVIVVPAEFKPVNKIIMLYDGEPSSVYAIKLFSYLFPKTRQLPVEVITIKSDESDRHVPEGRLMKELMNRHFDEVVYTTVQGDPEKQIIEQLKYRQHDELIVLGAYERGDISRWFKPSMADLLIGGLKAPLFIAHR